MITYTFKRKLFAFNEKGEVITMAQRRDELRKKFGVKEGQSVVEALGEKTKPNTTMITNPEIGKQKNDNLNNRPGGGITYNKNTKAAINNTKEQVHQQNNQQIMQKYQQRQVTQSAAGKAAVNKAFQAGQQKALNQPQPQSQPQQQQSGGGLLSGLRDTWKNSGTLGKLGMIGGGILAVKGLGSMLGIGRRRRNNYY